MTTADEAFRAGALAMKTRIIEAVRADHDRATAGDQCTPEGACPECVTWYRAIAAIEAVSV